MGDAAARWLARSSAEEASATVFEVMAHRVGSLGLDAALAARLREAAADERRHGALCREVAHLAGDGAHEAPPSLGLPPSELSDPLAALAADVTYLLAAGETVAVALIEASARPPCRDDVAATLRAIVADERRHAQLGWDLLDALLAVAPEHRTSIARVLSRQAMRVVVAAEAAAPASPELRAWGILPRATARDVAMGATIEKIAPRLVQLGVWTAPVPVPPIHRA